MSGGHWEYRVVGGPWGVRNTGTHDPRDSFLWAGFLREFPDMRTERRWVAEWEVCP